MREKDNERGKERRREGVLLSLTFPPPSPRKPLLSPPGRKIVFLNIPKSRNLARIVLEQKNVTTNERTKEQKVFLSPLKQSKVNQSNIVQLTFFLLRLEILD